MDLLVEDDAAVIAVVEDYWQGWFHGDAERMARALHPSFAKTGVGVDAAGEPVTEDMGAEDMIGWTREGQGKAGSEIDFACEITVDDRYYHLATVTVRSGIYREYLHVMKTPAGWKLLHALYMRVRED